AHRSIANHFRYVRRRRKRLEAEPLLHVFRERLLKPAQGGADESLEDVLPDGLHDRQHRGTKTLRVDDGRSNPLRELIERVRERIPEANLKLTERCILALQLLNAGLRRIVSLVRLILRLRNLQFDLATFY